MHTMKSFAALNTVRKNFNILSWIRWRQAANSCRPETQIQTYFKQLAWKDVVEVLIKNETPVCNALTRSNEPVEAIRLICFHVLKSAF